MGSEDARKLILARRARFVAAALASVAATTTALGASVEACGGETVDQGGGGDAGPQPCLSPTADPRPCLSQRIPDAGRRDASEADAANDGGDAGGKDADADPQPCLAPPIDP